MPDRMPSRPKEIRSSRRASSMNHSSVVYSSSSTASFAKYSEAIALAPQNAVLYSNRAATLIKMGRLDAALNDATKHEPLSATC